jgi:RNA polymerase sigma-70 factor (ECF subfamily)
MPPDPAISELVNLNQGFVKALAIKFAPTPGSADDIAQQVFLEFVAKSEKWDLTADVKPLLAVMTRNVARRFWRYKSREMTDEMRDLAEYITTLAQDEEVPAYSEEEKSALKNCVEQLSDKGKRLVQLHYYVGATSVEIAQRMGMNSDAVRRALFRQRGQLRQCIQKLLAKGARA